MLVLFELVMEVVEWARSLKSSLSLGSISQQYSSISLITVSFVGDFVGDFWDLQYIINYDLLYCLNHFSEVYFTR